MPRGGVPIGLEVAAALSAPLDLILVRKLGAPSQPELAVGALGEAGEVLIDRAAVSALGIGEDALQSVVEAEGEELRRRVRLYRAGRPPVDISGRTALITDDGIATGLSAAEAVRLARARGAARVVVAVPVAPHDLVAADVGEPDTLIVLERPVPFLSVGQAYDDFAQLTDEDVSTMLNSP